MPAHHWPLWTTIAALGENKLSQEKVHLGIKLYINFCCLGCEDNYGRQGKEVHNINDILSTIWEVSRLNIHGPTLENVLKNIATEEYPGKECVIRKHTSRFISKSKREWVVICLIYVVSAGTKFVYVVSISIISVVLFECLLFCVSSHHL